MQKRDFQANKKSDVSELNRIKYLLLVKVRDEQEEIIMFTG
jgi:hypothetical protein